MSGLLMSFHSGILPVVVRLGETVGLEEGGSTVVLCTGGRVGRGTSGVLCMGGRVGRGEVVAGLLGGEGVVGRDAGLGLVVGGAVKRWVVCRTVLLLAYCLVEVLMGER